MDNPQSQTIALVDCDSFYASCEQLVNPALMNKPVCVMSNNDGCIVARSKEAKRLGIKMGMPAFQARKLFPKVHYISGRLDLYQQISSRIISILREFSPVVEVYSIDEAFIDLAGLRKLYRKSYLDIASEIRDTIKNRVGIPVSIGISSSKTLSKLATERAKKGYGVYQIDYLGIKDELIKTDLINIWGVGRNTAALLNKFGIYTAYDLVMQQDNFIQKILGKKGLELKLELQGQDIYTVSGDVDLPKSIQKTSSFAKATSNEQYIKDSIHYHAHRACVKLRKLGMKTRSVGVMLRTKDFKIYFAKQALSYRTDWEFEIFEAANNIFYEIFDPDVIYRSSGVILDNLTEINDSQLSLFNTADTALKHQKLASAWDKLESKYGRNVILIGDCRNAETTVKSGKIQNLTQHNDFLLSKKPSC